MLTLKLVMPDEQIEWHPVEAVSATPGAPMTGGDGDLDLVGLVCSAIEKRGGHVPDGIWHAGARPTDEWFAMVIQAQIAGRGGVHNFIHPQGMAYLVGPDGSTIDRI